jgi:hypothetical protein
MRLHDLQAELLAVEREERPHSDLLWTRDEGTFRAGCITDAADFWAQVLLPGSGLDPSTVAKAMRWVTTGVNLAEFMRPFDGQFAGKAVKAATPPAFWERNKPFDSPAHAKFAGNEVAALVARGVLGKVATRPHVVMPLSVAENATKMRLVYDARYLNLFTPSPKMRYDSLRNFQRGIGKDDMMFSLDHKSGYHHIPMAVDSQQLLGVQWGEDFYVWKALPFGWAPACYVYNTLSTALAAHLRRLGLHVVVYLDDFGFAILTLEMRVQARWVWIVMAATYMAGYVVSLPKSRLCPSRVLQLLGFIVDSAEQQFRVPEAKLEDILRRLRALRAHRDVAGKPRDRSSAPLREIQSIAGKLQALLLAVPGISIFLRSSFLAIRVAEAHGATHVRVTTDMLHDYKDLLSLQSWTPMSRWRSEEHRSVRMDTDASGHGWGGCLWTPEGAYTARGLFEGSGRSDPIHLKEAWAVVYTLREVGNHVRDCELDLYTDNEIVRFTLMRGAGDYMVMRTIAKELFRWQLARNVRVTIHRVTTEDNLVADTLSRTGEITPIRFTHYRLCKDKFKLLQSWMPKRFTLDLCASTGTNLLPRFVAPDGDGQQGCIATNAFTCNLLADPLEFVYCYPPWAIISPLLRHLRLAECRGVMLIPADPTKQWYGSAIQGQLPGILARKGDMNTVYRIADDGSVIPVQLQHDLLVLDMKHPPQEALPAPAASSKSKRRN